MVGWLKAHIYSIRDFVRRKLTIFSMSPDCYQRYKFVSDILLKEGCETVLDVGGGSWRFFKRFLPNTKSLTVDIEGGNIIGSGTSLPFEKNSFDAVTALETLEHVEKKDRKKFIQELIRVAKKCVIISVPLDDPILRLAEWEYNLLHRSMFGKGNRWLEEHAENGLPTRREMYVFLNGYSVETYSICNLSRWKKMLMLGIVLQKVRLWFFLPLINFIYIMLYGPDSEEPTYTKIFFVKDVNR